MPHLVTGAWLALSKCAGWIEVAQESVLRAITVAVVMVRLRWVQRHWEASDFVH